METIISKNIRNVCLLGHGGSGKTSLTESMLYISKATERLGKISEGNTVCDYDPEEVKRGFSLSAAMAVVNWKDIKINILDAPGYYDFEGEARQCVRVADSAVIVVDGKAGIEVGTELAWDMATEAKLPKSFFINRFDDGEARFYKVFNALRERFGVTVCPLHIPCIDGDKVIGFMNLIDRQVFTFDSASGQFVTCDIPEQFMPVADEYRGMLMESIAQTSEELMEKFFAGEEITYEEAVEAIHEGIIHGDIVPVLCGAAVKNWGVMTLLNIIASSFPRPTARKVEHVVVDGEIKEKEIDRDGAEPSVFVYKTVADPFVGKLSYFKVMNGTLKKDTSLRNIRTGETEKISRLYQMRGKKQLEVDELACGDLGVTAKLVNTNTNDTLTTEASDFAYTPIVYPSAYAKIALKPKSKGDEDKISSSIARLLEEDPSLKFENNREVRQMWLYGLGDMHIDVVCSKLKSRFGVAVEQETPKIPYRESIRSKADGEGKHKKQSGGSGQYGHVKVHFAPGNEEGLTFTESTFGGSVPKNFHPAVQKGIEEAMQTGILAGYPMVNLAADLYDGSYHDVDSNEISFKLAAILAYKDGIPKAKPILLEPIGELKVLAPDAYVGDVMGDLNRRRGRVMGIEAAEKEGYQVILAEVPLAEMGDYVVTLRAATQGRARFNYELIRYDEAPAQVTQKVIAEAANN